MIKKVWKGSDHLPKQPRDYGPVKEFGQETIEGLNGKERNQAADTAER